MIYIPVPIISKDVTKVLFTGIRNVKKEQNLKKKNSVGKTRANIIDA